MKKKITKHYELPEIVVRGKKPLRYVMKPEDQLDFIGSLTGGLFSFFSPTQVARKVYDVSKSIKNKEGIDKIGKAIFQTNSGIVTKKFEKEHPIGAAITNLVGDVAIPAGLFGTAKGINYLTRMDMPRFGYASTTKYLFTPGYAGANGGKVEKTIDPETKNLVYNIANKIRKAVWLNNKDEIKILRDRLVNSNLLSLDDANYLVQNIDGFFQGTPSVTKTVNKALVRGKGKRGFNSDILLSKDAETMISLDYKAMLKMYLDVTRSKAYLKLDALDASLSKLFDAPVKWNWFNGGILAKDNIPANMAIQPAYINGLLDSLSIMSRFLNSMNGELIQSTFLKLVKDGELLTIGHLWVVSNGKGSFDLVDPTRYTLNKLLLLAKSPNRIDFILSPAEHGGLTTNIPWHGTNLSGSGAITKYNDPTRTRPLFTSMDNGKPGFSNVKTAYGTAAKLPMMKTSYERPLWEARPGMSHSSNAYDGRGELLEYFKGRGSGKARLVIDVSDARSIPGNNGLPLDEYNFGLHTPDVKSLFNTFDFTFDKSGKLIIRNGAFSMKNGGLINTIINYGRKDNKRFRSI